MAENPNVTNDEIVAGVRTRTAAKRVRVRKRTRLRPTQGLTGSYFERVQLDLDGARHKLILKYGELPFGPQSRERLFFEGISDEVPMRVPRAFGVGTPRRNGDDGWIVMETLPRGKRLIEWTLDETQQALRNLAALHARYLDDAPKQLPRPFTAELELWLSFVPEGVRMLRQRYEDLPALPRAASEPTLDLALELAARPEVLAAAFARSPETLLHGDYHRGNLVAVGGQPQAVFDWQFICAGPPAYDLAVFWLYLGAVTKPGFLRFFDRAEVRERSMSWDDVVGVYGAELLRLRPDADLAAITSCSDAAIASETLRQLTYMGHGFENFLGIANFVYRDHRTIGRRLATWFGVNDVWKMYGAVFADFEERATRLLASRH